MVRYVEIKILCSRCHDSGIDTPGDNEERITVGSDTVMLDLCDTCRAEWFEPFVTMARRIGINPNDVDNPAEAPTFEFDKLVCPIHQRRFTAAKSCREHIQAKHPEFWESEASLFWHAAKDRVPCDYCGEPMQAGTGMAAHKRTQHPAEFRREQEAKGDAA